jgi:3'(2'), 5'-bisphosphate nucleotidase
MNHNYKDICLLFEKAVKIAAKKIINTNYNLELRYKSDKSPVTKADIESNKAIIQTIKHLNFPIISEESKVNFSEVLKNKYYVLIDPLDGTKEYISGGEDYTINIALMFKNEPIIGVIYAPKLDELYSAIKSEGAFLNRKPISLNMNKIKNSAVVSKSHLHNKTEEYLKSKNFDKVFKMGSSLKLCKLAYGEFSCYPRFSPCKEWDIAAGNLILSEMGGEIIDLSNGKKMRYGKLNLINGPFIASL